MEESAGRFEKRFILDSLLPDRPLLVLSFSGLKLRARLSSVDARDILLELEGNPSLPEKNPSYALDIPFRGLVFRSAGTVLSKEGSTLRIPLGDPWRLLTSPAPSRTGKEPAAFLSSGDSRIEISFPLAPPGPKVQDLSAFAVRLAAAARAFGMAAEFRLPDPDARLLPFESLLLASARPLAVLDAGIPENGSGLFLGFPFLGRSEYESLLAFEGGDAGERPPTGFHLCLRLPSGLRGLLRVLPRRQPFSSFGPAEIFRLFALESLFSRPALTEGRRPLASCLSLQADGMILSLDPLSELGAPRAKAPVRVLLAYPGRDISFSAGLIPVAASGPERLAILSFENGRPEDYRFLFETLYGIRFDGAAADYLIKKAAP